MRAMTRVGDGVVPRRRRRPVLGHVFMERRRRGSAATRLQLRSARHEVRRRRDRCARRLRASRSCGARCRNIRRAGGALSRLPHRSPGRSRRRTRAAAPALGGEMSDDEAFLAERGAARPIEVGRRLRRRPPCAAPIASRPGFAIAADTSATPAPRDRRGGARLHVGSNCAASAPAMPRAPPAVARAARGARAGRRRAVHRVGVMGDPSASAGWQDF